jgi:hypothetical protein
LAESGKSFSLLPFLWLLTFWLLQEALVELLEAEAQEVIALLLELLEVERVQKVL